MFNAQTDLWLFKSLQEYYTYESTEEAIIRQAAEARKPKVRARLLQRFKAGFSAFGAKLKAGDRSSRRASEPVMECVPVCEGGTTR
jgi:predicted secreted protein